MISLFTVTSVLFFIYDRMKIIDSTNISNMHSTDRLVSVVLERVASIPLTLMVKQIDVERNI